MKKKIKSLLEENEKRIQKKILKEIEEVKEIKQIDPITAYSTVISCYLDEPENFFDIVDEETGERYTKSKAIGFLVIERDKLIRLKNTLQGRPS